MNNFLANYKTNKLCAFCKYWYNPSGVGVSLRPGGAGFADLDRNQACPCLRNNNINKKSIQTCFHFERKVEFGGK